MNKRKDLAMLHLAVAMFGMAGVIGKFVSWPAAAVTFGRVLFSSLFLLIFMSVKKEKIRPDCIGDLLFMAAAGVVMAVHWTSFIHSIQISSVAVGTITFAAFPLFVTFLEPLLYHERLKTGNIIISLIMLAGVAVTIPQFSLQNNVTAGVMWGMVSSFTYAVLSLMNRKLSNKYSGRQICLHEQGTATLILLPFAAVFTANVIKGEIIIDFSEVAAVVFMGIVCTAAAHSMFISSLKNVKVHTAGIISGMETVYSIIFAMILLHDMVTLREVIGGVVILGASLYKTLRSDSD